MTFNGEKIKKFIQMLNPSLLEKEEGEISLLIELAYPHLKAYKKTLGQDFYQSMALATIHMSLYSQKIASFNEKEEERISQITQGDSSISFFKESIWDKAFSTSSEFWSSTLAGSLLRELLRAHNISLSGEESKRE